MTPRTRSRFRRTFIREWRNDRGLTLEHLADRLGTTHATLSRIERGMQPYSQDILERLADALRTDPASLLMRNPSSPDAIWSIWDQAKPGEREMIIDLARTVIKRTAG